MKVVKQLCIATTMGFLALAVGACSSELARTTDEAVESAAQGAEKAFDTAAETAEKAVEAIDPAPEIRVPAGTIVDVRLDDHLDSGEDAIGDPFSLTVSRDVVIDDAVAIPAGARIRGTITSVEPAGRPNKSGRLEVRTDSLEVRGETVPLDATIRFEGEKSLEEDLEEIGIAGAVGAALGAIVEGGDGAVIGGIVGAGGTFLATKGEQVELEPGTSMIVELREATTVPATA